MGDTPLPHNPRNGVTGGVWRRGDAVHKLLTHRRAVSAGWASSGEPRHWNYWRREALVYASGLPARLGLGAPRLLGVETTAEGDIELRLEAVAGRHAGTLTIDDLEAAAEALGRAQGQSPLPNDAWLSHGYQRGYARSRPAHFSLLDDHAAWAQPLICEQFDRSLRLELLALHDRSEWLLGVLDQLPRTVCHLDVWPNNLFRRPDGEVVLIDWSFVGDGALGEDISNLILDSVFDLHLPPECLDELDERLTAGYLRGLRDAGWCGEERLVRLGICAAAVKYDWLGAACLYLAGEASHAAYGTATDSGELYRARAAGLTLCTRWAREAERLASPAPPASGAARTV
jgi:hypothetical protein